MTLRETFSERLRQGQPLAGIFQKFASHQVVEILGLTGMDFVVLDAEHAPFDPSQIDVSILASQAVDMPLLVRIASADSASILSVLDMGAAGIFVPHVTTGDMAAEIVSASRYKGGTRGFSPSTRAGGYGQRGLGTYMDAADAESIVIFQIEDAEALDNLDAIASVAGVSGLFVGRADLAVSLGVDWNDPAIDAATRSVADVAQRHGIAAGSYLADATRVPELSGWGISFFVLGSDQGTLKNEVARTAASFKSATSNLDRKP